MNILDPQGPIGVADKTILIDSLAIMLAIVLPTIVAIFGFAYWFRASNPKAFYWPNWEYSGRLELVVWSIPALERPIGILAGHLGQHGEIEGVLALAFGVLIILLVMCGSLWIMANLNHNMMPMDQLMQMQR